MTRLPGASTLEAMREPAAHALVEDRPRPSDAEVFFTREVLDRVMAAVLLVTPTGDVTFANRASVALLSHRDGIRLRSTGGHPRLRFLDKAQQHRFDVLVAALAGSPDGARTGVGLRVARPSSKPDYVVQISSLERLAAHEERAVVFITDPCEHHRLDERLLATVYALTAAELRVAEALLGDHSLGEIATMLQIQESTARSQLSSLFRKTRTSRQAQLVKLLMSLRLR